MFDGEVPRTPVRLQRGAAVAGVWGLLPACSRVRLVRPRLRNMVVCFFVYLGGDMLAWGLNAANYFLNDFKLVQKTSRFCKRSDMDRIFMTVDGG